MKRQRTTPGAIVKIDLGENRHTYGRLLVHPYMQVYDAATSEEIADMKTILAKPTLFKLCVFDHAIKKGRWPIVGTTLFEESREPVQEQFLQDRVNSKRLRIIDWHGNTRPATLAECRPLEACAVWEPEHVEDRIRDHYAGRPNVWLEQLKLVE